jgi:hypothetical protein
MKRTILNMILMSILMLLPAVTFIEPVYAVSCGNSSAAQQVSKGINAVDNSSSCNDSGVQTAIHQAVNILSLVVGAAAIIVIIVSGFKYITSGGDSGKVGNAKNTLIYALVGLAIAALAQVLVHFILSQSNAATLPLCSSDHSLHPPDCTN